MPIPTPDVPVPIADGSIFVALYDYSARTENELSFVKGEKLRVTSRDNENWWEAESLSSKKLGWVPSNYVAQDAAVEKNNWHHGKVCELKELSLFTKLTSNQ